MYYLIYEIKNKITDKIYVGYHRTNNLDDGYMGSGYHIKRAIKKYGLTNFEKRILHFCNTEEDIHHCWQFPPPGYWFPGIVSGSNALPNPASVATLSPRRKRNRNSPERAPRATR